MLGGFRLAKLLSQCELWLFAVEQKDLMVEHLQPLNIICELYEYRLKFHLKKKTMCFFLHVTDLVHSSVEPMVVQQIRMLVAVPRFYSS